MVLVGRSVTTGLDWTGPDRTGQPGWLGWAGLDWTGLDWTGLDCHWTQTADSARSVYGFTLCE